jgi:hypothetical protein
MHAQVIGYPTPSQYAFACRPLHPRASVAERAGWLHARNLVAAMDDDGDFPPAEYGPAAMRASYLTSGAIFPVWNPESLLSHQPPRYEHRVIQVVDPVAFQGNRKWLAVLVGVVKNDDISPEDFANNWKEAPRHLDRDFNQRTDVLVAAIITYPGNQLVFIRCDNCQLVQPFDTQHPQNDGTTFYYKWGWRAHIKKYNTLGESYIRRFMQVKIGGNWESALWAEG